AAGPGIAPEGVDHRAADAALRERLELDPARLVIPARGVDQPDHAVLDEVTQFDRVRHRGGHPARERLDEGKTGCDSILMTGGKWLTLHGSYDLEKICAASVPRLDLPGATLIPNLKRRKDVATIGWAPTCKSLIICRLAGSERPCSGRKFRGGAGRRPKGGWPAARKCRRLDRWRI